MAEKVLFVDDEADLLKGYQIMLRGKIEVETALSGPEGLETVHDRGPYAVVISDMRMPGMSGVEFLAQVRKAAPDTVRMMLTGHTDVKVAMDAVNEGNIFRFLTKPCEPEVLTAAINAGLIQYRLITAERELLESTLMASIKVLTDVLAAVSPQAFGRSIRIVRYVRHLVSKFRIPPSWCFEAAAMLSQLGCITLQPEVMRSAYLGADLTPEEQSQFEAHPRLAAELLSSIPRLEPVAWMISQQLAKDIPHDAPQAPALPREVVMFGAKMLKTAVAYDNLKCKGLSSEQAILNLRHRPGFDAEIVDMLVDVKTEEDRRELRKLPIGSLALGMILQQDIKNQAGLLVVARGQEVTPALLALLANFPRAQFSANEVLTLVPV